MGLYNSGLGRIDDTCDDRRAGGRCALLMTERKDEGGGSCDVPALYQ